MDNQAREHGQANFSLPHDVVPLPTQGVFYKNKKKSIKVGYLTANDENILMAGGTDMTQPSDDGTFVTTLPKSQTTVKLKPMTYGEIMEIQRLSDSYPQGRTVPKVTWRLNKQIIEINGVTDKAEIAKFIEQMPIADSKFIRQFMDDNEPRLDLSRTLLAPSGEKLTVNVGFGVDFFRPFF
jgi:hypothetical protein